jgi:hypothetical protein
MDNDLVIEGGLKTLRGWFFFRFFRGFLRAISLSAAGVEFLLFDFTRSAAIILSASLFLTLLSMRLPAAKGTSQIIAAGVSGMGEEKYAAMPASF